jgi:tripartite-type tricarboxylate transporter receptor subunit TctC
VSIVVPYAPGGPVDNLSRVLATRLGKEWGQSVLVVNKTGANEIISAEFVARAPPTATRCSPPPRPRSP